MYAMTTRNVNLLIVDDEPVVRSLLSDVFASCGHKTRSAEDGFAALQLIRDSIPDVLLSDLNMPGMSGFELLSVVRRLYPQIHVIAMSGAYSGTSVPRGIAADGFHEKATGMKRLIELMAIVATDEAAAKASVRGPSPLWVDLVPAEAADAQHVLINCPQCLRPFRQVVQTIDANIREAACVYCGGEVSYAIAFAINPQSLPIRECPRATNFDSKAA
jgi:CheY-like chemotaxis protein